MSDEELLRRRIEAQIAARRAGAAIPGREQPARRSAEPEDQSQDSGVDHRPDYLSEPPPFLEPVRPWLEDETRFLPPVPAGSDEPAPEPYGSELGEYSSRPLEPIRPWELRPQFGEPPERPAFESDPSPTGGAEGLTPVRPWLLGTPDTGQTGLNGSAHSGRPEPQFLPLTPEMLTGDTYGVSEQTDPTHRRGLHLFHRHDGPSGDFNVGIDDAPALTSLFGVNGHADPLGTTRQAEIEAAKAERDVEARRRSEAEARLMEAEQRLAEAQEAARIALAAEAERMALLERESAATREQTARQLELARAAEQERVQQALQERAVEAQRRLFAEQQLAEAEQRLAELEQTAAQVGGTDPLADQARQADLQRRLELERRLEETERRLIEAERAAQIAKALEEQRRMSSPMSAPPEARTPAPSATPGIPAKLHSIGDLSIPPAEATDETIVMPRHSAASRTTDEQWTEIVSDRPLEDERPARKPSGLPQRTREKHSVAGYVRLGVLLLVIAVAALLVRTYVVGSYYIPSGSMEPTLHGCQGCNNDHVLVNKLSYKMHAIHRGDVVVFHRPKGAAVSEAVLIKRVIGLPGDVLSDRKGVLYVNGLPLDEPYLNPACHGTTSFPKQPVQVPEGQLYVMGDNRCDSSDSRTFGPIAKSSVIGRAFIIIWPLGRVHYL